MLFLCFQCICCHQKKLKCLLTSLLWNKRINSRLKQQCFLRLITTCKQVGPDTWWWSMAPSNGINKKHALKSVTRLLQHLFAGLILKGPIVWSERRSAFTTLWFYKYILVNLCINDIDYNYFTQRNGLQPATEHWGWTYSCSKRVSKNKISSR